MRIRRYLLAGLLVVGSVVALPSVAYAQEEHGEELVECVESALSDNAEAIEDHDYEGFENDLEDCKKAKSLVTPALPEIIWGGIAFLIVLALLMKFAFPALKKGLKQREETIREELESAARAREEAEAEAAQYRAQIGDARSEANTILEETRADAERVRREMLERAEAEVADVRQRAQEDIRLAQDRAMADLRSQVTDLTIDLAERVVGQSLDRPTQVAIIDRYIDDVERGSP